jgi:hypothetical protein
MVVRHPAAVMMAMGLCGYKCDDARMAVRNLRNFLAPEWTALAYTPGTRGGVSNVGESNSLRNAKAALEQWAVREANEEGAAKKGGESQ